MRKGFTIVELLVVISIIALLIGLLLPALGKARDSARLHQSSSNLRQVGAAHLMYASEWNDRQFQLSRDDFGAFGNNLQEYFASQGSYNIPLGWAQGFQWIFAPEHGHYEPIVFQGAHAGFGYFRTPNVPALNQYLSGRMFDPVWWAPKDRVLLDEWGVEECFEHPGELCLPDGGVPYHVVSSYCLSPAALYSPDVFSPPPPVGHGWTNPWSLAAGFRTPTMSQARYPDLKTQMIEHNWLQNPPTACNPNFIATSPFTECEPYYFNHGFESRPVTLFYDSHIAVVGTAEAERADLQHIMQAGYGLWSRDTTFGTDGYFISDGYDTAADTSFHILTTDGILGRDVGGGF
jgi:prepilin-type N-terminal cleavage/methylation domain-containing protein